MSFAYTPTLSFITEKNRNSFLPLILTGPAGCGKSHSIRTFAYAKKIQILICPCRKDKTLRDGRQKLHLWAKRTDPAIIWLEGADDLTPEAQAFLRRILETHSEKTMFVLECRNSGKLQDPIRSRCIIQRLQKPSWNILEVYTKQLKLTDAAIMSIKNYLTEDEYSFRRIKQCINIQKSFPDIWDNITEKRHEENQLKTQPQQIISYIKKAYNPEILLKHIINNNDMLFKNYSECIGISGSLWAFLASALHDNNTVTNTKEE